MTLVLDAFAACPLLAVGEAVGLVADASTVFAMIVLIEGSECLSVAPGVLPSVAVVLVKVVGARNAYDRARSAVVTAIESARNEVDVVVDVDEVKEADQVAGRGTLSSAGRLHAEA